MGFSTFSGPIRSGTVREGPNRNAGLAVLSQSYDTGDLTGTGVSNVDVNFGRLPRGSQIVDIVVDQVVAAGTGTMTISVGNASGGAQLAAAVDSSVGGRFRGTASAATQLAWQTSLSAHTPLWARVAVGTNTLTAGRAVVTVLYVQRAPDGTQHPAES
jgi:hypothetical protein